MGKLGKWFLLLSKRLYKKPSFLVFLMLIPLCVVAFRLGARQDSGVVHIMLAQQAQDSLSAQVIASLQAESAILQFSVADSPQQALDAVETGLADEAWIFPSDTEQRVETYVQGKADYVVSIVTREDGLPLQLAREKLSGALYEACAKAYYLEFIRGKLSSLDDVSNRELIAYFDHVQVDEDFFVYGKPADQTESGEPTNYLTSPIRGLLAVLVTVCGMAATMYYMQDVTAGTFCLVKETKRGLVALGCVATAVVQVSAVVLLTLFASKLGGNFWREAGILLLNVLSTAAFCLLLKEVLPGIRLYGSALPMVTVIMLGICPVFFDFRKLYGLQLVFPTTYYINALYDSRYLVYMLAFAAGCLLLAYLLHTLKKRLFHSM